MLCAVLLFLSSALASPSPWPEPGQRAISQFRFQQWTREHGLPSDSSQALVRTPEGYLWIGTSEGLARFDGKQFRVYDNTNTAAFAGNEVRALASDAQGQVYVMLSSGPLLRGNSLGFERIGEFQGAPALGLHAYADGSLLICRLGGLWRYSPARGLETLVEFEGYPACQRGADGVVHATAVGQVWVFDRDDSARFRRVEIPALNHPRGRGIHVEAESIWVWNFATLLELDVNGDVRRRQPTPEALRECWALRRDALGTLWCAANAKQGLARSSSDPSQMTASGSGIGNATALDIDASGALWVASLGQGLFRISEPPVLTFGAPEGLDRPRIAYLHQRDAQTMLVGGRQSLYAITSGAARALATPQADQDRLLAVSVLPGGDLLLAKMRGLDRSPWPPTPDSWVAVVPPTIDGIYALERTSDGETWLGAPGARGVARFDEDDGLTVVDPDTTTVYAFVVDAAGRRYAATNDGVWVQGTDGRFSRVLTPAPANRFILMSALRDRRGHLWFGGYEIGLLHFDGRRWTRLTVADGLPGNTGYGVLDDERGRLWVSHGRGLYTLTLDSVDAYGRDPSQPLAIRHYTRADGLRGESFNGGGGHAAVRAQDGSLWFASDDGAVQLDPNRLPQPIVPPQPLIEAIEVDGKAMPTRSGPLLLLPGTQQTRVHLGVPAPGVAESIDVRWRSRPDLDWQMLADNGVIDLQRLPSGQHRLEVQTGVAGNFAAGLVQEIVQQPRWHQRVELWILLSLAVVLAGWVMVRWRWKALRIGNERLQALVAERGAALVDEQRKSLEADAARRDAERELHFRRLAAARDCWAQLDGLARLVLAPIAAAPAGLTRAQVADGLRTVEAVTGAIAPLAVDAALARLATAAVVAETDGLWRIVNDDLSLLPDLALPLAQQAQRAARRVGAYRLLESIGSGGNGEVYRAINIDDGSEAALKLLYADPELKRDATRRLDREGEIVARLHHPNIVRMLERGEHDGRLYLAMELVHGETLAARIERAGALPIDEVRSIAAQLAAALAALHAAGVVHRDVNPNNIMIEPGGRVVLLDFGLARGTRHSTLTRPQTLLGTLPYMAPEQLRGEEATPAADVWALGVLCAEMLHGTLPWRGESSVEMAVEVGRFRTWSDYPECSEPFWRERLQDILRVDAAARVDAATLADRLGQSAP